MKKYEEKDMANFPIGSIIDNQKKLNKFAGTKINLLLNLEKIDSKMLLEISELRKELILPSFPKKIDNFNAKYHIQGQILFHFKR